MKILPVFIRRRVIRIRFLNFLKKESHSFVLRGTVAMLFLFSTGILYAQKVSVRYKDVPLKNVLNDVAKQSKLRLAYSGSFTDLSVKVSVQASGKDVKEVLAELSQKTNVNFEVRNGSIYIYIKEPPQKEKKEKASFSLSGTVYDENNLPLIGVNVLIKGTTKGTSSNMDGEFTITAEKGDILVLSYLGYTSKELTVKNKEPMRIVMSEDTKVLSEVVVIGYGAVRKTDVTGAISSIKMDDLSITTPTLEQALVGHAAGVEIKQTSGSPGEGLSLRVRGVSSINAGSEPLYVVDGFPTSKDVYINPNDVASIEVLKDAASVAIYGSRAAGGVVLITTKRGTNSGRAKVEYDFQYGFQQVDHKIKMLDAYGMRDLSIECANNAYRDWCTKNGKEYDPLHNNEYRMSVAGATSGKIFQIPDIFFDFTTGQPVEPAYNTDWQDAIFSTAPIMKHNLNITGGSDRIRYMASAGYMEQDGIIAPSYHHRFTTRFNIDGKLTEHYLSDTVWSSTTYAIACAKLYRRSFISENDLHFTSIKCGEDIYFSLSAFYCNAKTKVIQYAGYYYVLNPGSITGSMNYKKNHERIMAELFDTFLKNHELSSIPQDRQDVIEYTYLANMINALISFNHGCGISLMKEKYAFAKADAESKFPNYLSNQYVGLLKPKGQRTKIRLGVGVVILLEKIHMARFLFYLIALI